MRAEIVGVTTDPALGVAANATGLYEFWTDAGEHVYLHDTDLVSLTYRPGPVPQLVAVFQYRQGWVPVEPTAKPVVVISFDNVRITHWMEDEEALAAMESNTDAAGAAGQMSDFEWDGENKFGLVAFAVEVWFTADRVAVETTLTEPGGRTDEWSRSRTSTMPPTVPP